MRTTDMAVQLGDRVKDPITGFCGIVVSITTWLNGCVRIGVQPEEMRDGKPVDCQHFDVGQLVVTKRGVHKPMMMDVVVAPAPVKQRGPGGPAREGATFRRS